MKNAVRVLVMIVAVIFIAASAKTKKYEMQSTVAPKGVTDADLYAGAVRVLADEGFAFRDRDKDAGIATTEWEIVEVGDSLTMSYKLKHAWRVTVEEGELVLSIDCRMPDGANCSSDHRAESWTKRAPELLERMNAEAAKRARKRARKQKEEQESTPTGEVVDDEGRDAGTEGSP